MPGCGVLVVVHTPTTLPVPCEIVVPNLLPASIPTFPASLSGMPLLSRSRSRSRATPRHAKRKRQVAPHASSAGPPFRQGRTNGGYPFLSANHQAEPSQKQAEVRIKLSSVAGPVVSLLSVSPQYCKQPPLYPPSPAHDLAVYGPFVPLTR